MGHAKAKVLHFNQAHGRGATFGRVVANYKMSNDTMPFRWHYLNKGWKGEDALRSIWQGLVGGEIQISKTTSGNIARCFRLAVKEGHGVDTFVQNVLRSKDEPIDLYYIVNRRMSVEGNPVILTNWEGRNPVMDFYQHLDTCMYSLKDAQGIISRFEEEKSRVYPKGSWEVLQVLGSDLPTVKHYPKDAQTDTNGFLDLLKMAGATIRSVEKKPSENGAYEIINISLTTEKGNHMLISLQDNSAIPVKIGCPTHASAIVDDTVRIGVLAKLWGRA